MIWADKFFREVNANGIDCSIIKYINGWPETMIIAGKVCFTKSVTYNKNRCLYFQGVDTKKLNNRGDYVLICGGIENRLQDVFVIPWRHFFETLRKGEPVNTYRPPKEYLQYKFKIKRDSMIWTMSVQGGQRPQLDVRKWRYDSESAIAFFK